MTVSLKSWMRIDKAFGPVYRAFHQIMLRLTVVGADREHVVIIKLFGMGSIIRLLGMCEEHGIDLSRVTLITSDSNRELCELWGLNSVLISTSSLRGLVSGSIAAAAEARRLRPAVIVDYERCSNLVGIFRT